MTIALVNDRYRVIKKLGSGGFGETFLAEDSQTPSRRCCVIKQLKPQVTNPQFYQTIQERFQREAAILEALGDGNSQIPRLYAYFEENGQFYLVQEWIDGESLSVKKRMSESDVKEILLNILPVLDYVHSKGIIHRDIKPDNIILRSLDGKPVLIDFGAVRETIGTQLTTGGNSTQSIVIGTPGFMPAEQAAGRPVFSSDLYSLGLTAIYLLTGKIPHELETDYRTGEIVWNGQEMGVSSAFKAVLDKAIQAHPSGRFPTAKAMLHALESNTIPVAATLASIAPPTVASPPMPSVAPLPSNTTPDLPPNRQKGIIISSLIIAASICVSTFFGLVLFKFYQPSSETSNSLTTESPSAPSTSVTPIASSPSETPIVAPSPPYRPPAEEAVVEQYAAINNRDYQAAWNRLSPRFQNNSSIFSNGYSSYFSWWSTVNYVDVQQVNVLNQTLRRSIVSVRLKYNMNNGKQSSESRRITLLWDDATERWLIDSTTVTS